MTVLRLSCVVCTKPDQPVIDTHAGRAPICAACLAILEPGKHHPDCACRGTGCKYVGERITDEPCEQPPAAPYWNMDALHEEAIFLRERERAFASMRDEADAEDMDREMDKREEGRDFDAGDQQLRYQHNDWEASRGC